MTRKKKPIITVYLLFIALMLSMYLPGLQKPIAAPTAMMIACCIILLIISYGIFRGKKPRAAGDIGTIYLPCCFSGNSIPPGWDWDT